jgi:nucleotide-binding universal stress UspA family protein
MIKNILCATDGSPHGDTACSYAFDLAKRLDARLELVHVVDVRLLDLQTMPTTVGFLGGWGAKATEGFRNALQTRGQEVLDAAAKRAAAQGLPVETTLEFGNPAQTLVDIEDRMELVVVGRQGEHAESSPGMTGSTMERYIRRSDRPVLVTPGEFKPVSRILVAVDGSPPSWRALHEAIELANPLEAPLLILSIAEGKGEEEQARSLAESAHASARAHNCAAAPFVGKGTPGEQILAGAAAHGADLLVLGAHGRLGKVYERMIGLTAAHLASQAPLPVLLVP